MLILPRHNPSSPATTHVISRYCFSYHTYHITISRILTRPMPHYHNITHRLLTRPRHYHIITPRLTRPMHYHIITHRLLTRPIPHLPTHFINSHSHTPTSYFLTAPSLPPQRPIRHSIPFYFHLLHRAYALCPRTQRKR